MYKGKIKAKIKDFGFIVCEEIKQDIFFHADVVKNHLYNMLDKDDEVEFEYIMAAKGPRATTVHSIGKKNKTTNPMPMHNTENDTLSNYRFLNPYNFVRFLDEGNYEEKETKLLGRCAPPPHDRGIGITGRITCNLENFTPLFISDAENIMGDPHKTYQFFKVGDEHVLPATALRGMIRNAFEAVTNSCMQIFEKDAKNGKDFPLEKRPGRPPELIPGRVVEINEAGATLEILDCSNYIPDDIDISRRPTITKCGLIQAYPERVLKSTYYSDPEPFNPSSPNNKLPEDIENNERVAILVSLIPEVKGHRYQYFKIEKIVKSKNHNELIESENEKKVFGYLYRTGPNIENKHDERIFFRWDDDQDHLIPSLQKIPKQHLISVDKEVIEEYNLRLDEYWERNKLTITELGEVPWSIDAKSLPHPSKFIKKGAKLNIGDLIYFTSKNGSNVTLLRPVSMPRIPHKSTRQSLLPEYLVGCDYFNQESQLFSDLKLCPTCRIFGWVAQESPPDDPEKIKPVAYRSRLKFSNGLLTGSPKIIDDQISLAILSSPKPTTTSFYLLDNNGNPSSQIDYDKAEAQLRGRKFYRHHKELNPREYQRPPEKNNDQNRSVRDVLDIGNTFQFMIDFENLSPIELGALLWSLELKMKDDKQLFHRLGYGKPLGFGSVQINVKTVEILNPVERYKSLVNSGWHPVDRSIWKTKCVNEFISSMEKCYGEDFHNLKNIQDLQALLGEPALNNIHYPRPPNTEGEITAPNPEGKQFEWFVGLKKYNQRTENIDDQIILPLAVCDNNGFPLISSKGNVG